MTVLRDAHGPEQAHAFRLANQLGGFDQFFFLDTGDLRSEVHGEGLKRLLVFLDLIDPCIEELLVGIALLEHVARQR